MCPELSVVMSVYNEKDFIKQSLDSLLNQTLSDYEIIVVDDGSSDGTTKILKNYQKYYSNIQVLYQDNNGLTTSLNRAIKNSSGDFIARADGDDIQVPTRLESQLRHLKENQEIGVVGSFYYEAGEITGKRRLPTNSSEVHSTLIRYNPISHGSCMISREVFNKIGLYDESLRVAQDYELWFRASRYFKLENLPRFLSLRRHHTNNVSRKRYKQQQWNALCAKFRAIKRGNYPPKTSVYLFRNLINMILPGRVKRLFKLFSDSIVKLS